MSRARGEKDYLNLLQGLNTESNPLAFPEGFTADELNFVLSKNGDIRIRRKGFENAEADQSYAATGNVPQIVGVHYWREADVFLVCIATLADEAVVRVHRNNSTFDFVDEYEVSSTSGINFIPSFSQVLNGVVITGGSFVGYTKPLFLGYNSDGDIDIYSIQLYFRDFELINDGLAISQRPGSVTDAHLYNLYNAGWYADRKDSTGSFVDPLTLFTPQVISFSIQATFTTDDTIVLNQTGIQGAIFQVGETITVSGSVSNDGTYTIESLDRSVPNQLTITTIEKTIVNEAAVTVDIDYSTNGVPSNADIPVLGLKTDTNGDEIFSADTLFETVVGSSAAPRGHYIYDVEESRTREDVLTDKGTDGTVSTTVTLEATIAL